MRTRETKRARPWAWLTLGVAASLFLPVAGSRAAPSNFCSQTADLLFDACRASIQDDSLVKQAICLNVSDAHQRDQCLTEGANERTEAGQLCTDQHDWRLGACASTGQARYDPSFDPALFDDPTHPTHPNPYFPLQVGDRWEYRGPGTEDNTVEITRATKDIEGVHCLVFKDVVFDEGVVTESTNDWFASAKGGDVWYCGEETAVYETFDGDNPMTPELVEIEGSFKAGRDRDKPGIIFLASPKPGDVYREEFSLGNAEDDTEVLSTDYAFGRDTELDHFVPQQLAERFCAGDCVVTKNFSLLEPGVVSRKYYARGIGVFLEVEDVENGGTTQLVNCNFDRRCRNLPAPAGASAGAAIRASAARAASPLLPLGSAARRSQPL